MLRKNPSGHSPQVSVKAFIDPTAVICGHVIIHDYVYVGPYAAVAGGITSYMEMPNVSPPTTTRQALREKFHVATKNETVADEYLMAG